MDNNNFYALIIGAGPSGLALAYELVKSNSKIKPIIIDKLSQAGGLSRTIYDDYSGIDIGGHRLFTKNKYIENIWKSFLGDDLIINKRFSSIIKDNKKYRYPLKFCIRTFKNLGFIGSISALFSYFKTFFVRRKGNSVEDFLINRFGVYLYNKFFKEHTRKIWGYDGSELINDWDKSRIQKFLFSYKTLWEDEFYYGKLGCSQLWDRMAQYITDNGGKIIFNTEFKHFKYTDNKIISAVVESDNKLSEIEAKYFISSIPLCDLIKTFDAPIKIKQSALDLKYRDYILVSLYSDEFNLKDETKFKTKDNITPDNWIYMQEKDTIASRFQIMNNWSSDLIKRGYLISLEYFCQKDDELWNLSDDELVNLAIKEACRYKLFDVKNIYRTKVIKEEKAYPIYTGAYKNIDKIRDYVKKYTNLYIMGRNGEHKYINMDYAMVCGITIARDIIKKDI